MGDELLLFGMLSVLSVVCIATVVELHSLRRTVRRLNSERDLNQQVVQDRLQTLDEKLNALRNRSHWDGI